MLELTGFGVLWVEAGRKVKASGWGQGHRIMSHEREQGMGGGRESQIWGVGVSENSDDRMNLRCHYI